MLPSSRNKRLQETDIKKNTPFNAGVIALFYPTINQETRLILILRKTYKGVHSGQIGFPGGRQELYDANIRETALRETYEEVGVRPSNITILRELTKIYIPPSNFWVYPFLGVAKNSPLFRRQENEVEKILSVKLEDLLDENNRTIEKITTDHINKMKVPAFFLNDHIVWGATAMILNEVKSQINSVL